MRKELEEDEGIKEGFGFFLGESYFNKIVC